MKVLMLSTDASILEPGSESSNRMKEYGTLAERLDIIVCTTGSPKRERAISENTRAIPTNSHSKFWYVRDMVRVAEKSIQNSVDLVTSQDPFETGLAGWWIARRLRAKLQLQIHTDFLSPYFWRESFKNKARVMLAKWLLPKANSIRVVSERIKQSLSKVNCQLSKVTVLPIFVDSIKIQSAPITVDLHKKYPQFDFIILMASRLAREKNISLAINAMSEVIKNHSRVGLIIVGDGPEKNNLRTNVVFESWTGDIASYYKTANVFLNTSNYEGYGRTLVEAAAAGLPVITTDVGVVGEAINKDNSLVIPVGDKSALTNSILKLIDDEKLQEVLSQKAQTAVQSLGDKEEYLKKYKQSWEMALV